MVRLRLHSESVIVIWGLKCKDSQITAKAGRMITKSLVITIVESLLCDTFILIKFMIKHNFTSANKSYCKLWFTQQS